MRKKAAAALASILVIFVTGCGGTATKNATPAAPAPGNTTAPAPASNASPIKVGQIGAETGALAANMKPLFNATQLAVDQFNAAGGYNGRKIELITCNSEGNPEKALGCAQKLVDQDKVEFILGPHYATEFAAAAPAFDTRILGVTATPNANLTGDKTTFMSTGPTFLPASTDFNYYKKQGWTKIGFLAGNDETGATAIKEVTPLAEQYGLTLFVERYDRKDVNVQAQVTRLLSQKPDVIMIWDSGAQVATVIKTITQLGWEGPVMMNYGNMGGAFMNLLKGSEPKRLLVGAVHATDRDAITDPAHKAIVDKFYADYQAKFNVSADFLAGQAYDATYLLISAIKAVGPDTPKMKAWLEAGNPVRGVNWLLKYDNKSHNGPTNADAMVVVEWKGNGVWQIAK